MKKLSAAEIRTAKSAVPEWDRRGGLIRREFSFQDFVSALKFVNAVGRAAEKAQHHPDIDIRWNKVRLALTTHDAEGLTLRDFELAQICDALAAHLVP